MSIVKLITASESLSVLFIAPPAWGKTHQLLELIKSQPHQRFVYLAPLRAIIEEVKKKLAEADIICDEKDWYTDLKIQVLVTTPEKWLMSFEKSSTENEELVFILDEFHLFYEWRSFRPQLEDCLFLVFSLAQKVLLLSATINKVIEEDFKVLSNKYFQSCYKIDLGNFTLRNFPKSFVPLKTWEDHVQGMFFFLKFLLSQNKDCILVFFNYRWQVKIAQKLSTHLRLSSLGCCGGESREFIGDLKNCLNPKIIWCTKVLSHGVNLPKIGLVVILSRGETWSTWIQMLGRGGRQGESFSAIAYPPE